MKSGLELPLCGHGCPWLHSTPAPVSVVCMGILKRQPCTYTCGDLRGACLCMPGSLLTAVRRPRGALRGNRLHGLTCVLNTEYVHVCVCACTSCPLSTENSTATIICTAPRLLHSHHWLAGSLLAPQQSGWLARLLHCGGVLASCKSVRAAVCMHQARMHLVLDS